MMHLAVVATGTLFGHVTLHEGDAGVVIGRDVLEILGVHDGDELDVHTDGRMLVLLPARLSDPRRKHAEGTSYGEAQDRGPYPLER